jgi:hypothetical protein
MHSLQWADTDLPRMLDADGDGVDDVVGLCHYNGKPELVAVSGKDGSVIWEASLADFKRDPSAIVIVGDNLILFDARGTMYGYGPSTGAQRWRSELPDKVREICRDNSERTFLVGLPDYTLRRVQVANGARETEPLQL